MQFIRQGATHKVVLGPFVDVTDGFTPETGVTLSGADEAEAIVHDSATVVDLSSYTFSAITTMDGYYNLTLQSGISGTVGHMIVVVQDDDVCLPVMAKFTVLEEAVYDQMFAAAAPGASTVAALSTAQTDLDTLTGSDGATLATTQGNYAPAKAGDSMDMSSISGDSVAADNLELMYDTTGYTDPTGPASRAQVDGTTGAAGGSVNIQATEDNTGGAIIDSVTFVGSVQGGTTFANTEAADGVVHNIDDTGDDIDIVYGFSVGGGRTGTSIVLLADVSGNTDEMKVKVFDHVGSDWEIIGTVAGSGGSAQVALDLALLLKHTGTGSELGKVYIRFDTDSTTPSNLSVDHLIVSAVNIGQSVGYALGSIWLDTNNGTAGTEAFVNGVADKPTNLIASAKTLSTSVGISDFRILNGSSFTLAESTANESYFGDNWTLALGGQATGGAHFVGAVVSGIQTGTGCSFSFGEIGTVTVADDTHITGSGLSGTITLPVGSVSIENCHHDGSSLPILDFGAAVGSTTVHLHSYAGGIEFHNLGDSGTDIVHLDGNGKIVINANSSGGTINLRGNWEIDNQADGVTINYDDQSQGYDLGQVWIDTVGGTAGTNDHINGTSDSPCLTLADAKTLSTSTGLSDFHVINGSSITLAETSDNESYFGDNWTLALGGQSVDGCQFHGATVSGAGPSAAVVHYDGCNFGAASLALAHCDFCAFAGTVTQTTAGAYEYHNCYSKGTTAPVFTKTAGQAIAVEFHNYSGDITISGLQSGDTVELGGFFRTIILNGADATVHVHGHYETLTNNLTGSPTVNITGAIKTADSAAILVDTAEIGTAGAGLSNITLANDLSATMKTSVQTAVDAAIDTAIAELSVAAPAATPTIRTALMLMYMALRNKLVVQTSGTDAIEIYNDAGTKIASKGIADDGSDYTESEMA